VAQDKIRGANRRIYLSTLYIGKTEHELIKTLEEALDSNPDLELSILTDALRGTREDPNPSCATLLAPLITKFGSRVKIAMFHTPNLNGWKKKYMPKRINEGWGLQHMKLYGFDDEIMLSGYVHTFVAEVTMAILTRLQCQPLRRLLHQPPGSVPPLFLQRTGRLLCQHP
jgi:phosphatidylserine/phosphatidylglycerophosphate/cardiolipin synthase-like enzyme